MASDQMAYADGAVALTGHVARPAGTPRAAVLVLPTIVNISPAVAAKAEALATAGYLALVADFYGEPVPSFEASFPMAGKLRADPAIFRARMAAGLAALTALPEAAGLPVAAIGFCMGGLAALELARAGADLHAVVSFHGLLAPLGAPAAAPIKPRILVCHGDADPMVPHDMVLGFWQEMDAAQAQWHFHAYGGVRHGFTDPSAAANGNPALAYDEAADRASWAAMHQLFGEVF